MRYKWAHEWWGRIPLIFQLMEMPFILVIEPVWMLSLRYGFYCIFTLLFQSATSSYTLILQVSFKSLDAKTEAKLCLPPRDIDRGLKISETDPRQLSRSQTQWQKSSCFETESHPSNF